MGGISRGGGSSMYFSSFFNMLCREAVLFEGREDGRYINFIEIEGGGRFRSEFITCSSTSM